MKAPSVDAFSTASGGATLIEINGQIRSGFGESGEADDSVPPAAPADDCRLPVATCLRADQPVPRDPCDTFDRGGHYSAYRRHKSTAGSAWARGRRQGNLEQPQVGRQ